MQIRKNYWEILRAGLAVCFSFCAYVSFSQAVQTVPDRKDILIGEQVRLTIKTILPPASYVSGNWVSLPDSIPHFDIVETGKPDSNRDNTRSIEQTIVFTSFDSGRWVFPSLPVEIYGAGQPIKKFQTDSLVINVSYAPADSTNQLRDIKPIIKVTVADYTWYYIAGSIILLLLIIILLYRYWKKKRKLKPGGSLSRLSAYDEAMEELNRLIQSNLQNAGEVKAYHSKLAEIFKRYAGRKQHKNLLSKTTGDLLVGATENNLTAEDISHLATALRCTDAVKFAKYMPLPGESQDCMLKIKETINLIEAFKPIDTKLLNTKPLN